MRRDGAARRRRARLHDRRPNAGERRRLGRAEVGVVDARDRDVLRDANARLAARHHRAHGEHVVGRDHRRRPRLIAGLPHRVCRGARSIGPYATALVEREPRLRQRGTNAGAALARAVVAFGGALRSAEAAVAEPDQVPRHREVGGAVVEADARDAGASVDAPGQHVRPPVASSSAKSAGSWSMPTNTKASTPCRISWSAMRTSAPGRSGARPAPASSPGSSAAAARSSCARTARSRTTARRRQPCWLRGLRSARARHAARSGASRRRRDALTASRVDRSGEFSARETVAVDTPARRATSLALLRCAAARCRLRAGGDELEGRGIAALSPRCAQSIAIGRRLVAGCLPWSNDSADAKAAMLSHVNEYTTTAEGRSLWIDKSITRPARPNS